MDACSCIYLIVYLMSFHFLVLQLQIHLTKLIISNYVKIILWQPSSHLANSNVFHLCLYSWQSYYEVLCNLGCYVSLISDATCRSLSSLSENVERRGSLQTKDNNNSSDQLDNTYFFNKLSIILDYKLPPFLIYGIS